MTHHAALEFVFYVSAIIVVGGGWCAYQIATGLWGLFSSGE